MYHKKGFNDPRYNHSELSRSIPSTRTSVYHQREFGPDPVQPRSFVFPNGIPPPLSFRSATESYYFQNGFYLLGSVADRTEPIYSEPPPDPYSQNMFFSNTRFDLPPVPHHPISRFPLFKFSETTVGRILSYLTGPDLAALALVDRDCRQLARTRQFRNVMINFSSASMALLTVLQEEIRERVSTGFKFRHGHNRWRLGSCIRCITICPYGESKEEKEKEKGKAVRNSWVEEKMASNKANEFHACHINALDIVLRGALPNLEYLDWKDIIPITPLIGSAIVAARTTKLELDGVILSEDFALDMNTHAEKWGLKTLVLNLRSREGGIASTYNFTTSILKLAAPTLVELIWKGSGFNKDARKHSLGEEPVQFPKLKKVQLNWVLADETVWSALIPTSSNSTLTELWVDGACENLAPFLARRAHISSLSKLTWIYIRKNELPHLISFITANLQLQSFRHDDRLPETPPEAHPDELQHRLLPILSSSVRSLTSLALTWGTLTIPPAALRSIATITTLQHLWLSAGISCTEELDWRVDHKILRKRLRPLKQLRWLVLTRDAYAHGNQYLYGYRQPREGDQHRDEMVRYARLFAESQSRLEWVYFGQIPMAVERGGEIAEVVVLSGQRNVETLLSQIWGEYRGNWSYNYM
ncbi:hypothetical protein Q9L58_006660 [Maublancomyces gigas]|uniref:F-box domain-containing protein n=1 Tax=Discina gigas TaxID=1032678 RepID=A0ABR3GEM7_9PEZI